MTENKTGPSLNSNTNEKDGFKIIDNAPEKLIKPLVQDQVDSIQDPNLKTSKYYDNLNIKKRNQYDLQTKMEVPSVKFNEIDVTKSQTL